MFYPPTIEPVTKPLGVIASLRAARQNALNILPAIAFTQPILTGKTGPARWHMVQGPEGMKRIFLDNHSNYPKSEVMIRMLRPVVGKSLFTAENAEWKWQRRAIAPVFRAKNVDALAPVMTATAQRACALIDANAGPMPMVKTMMSATFDVICDVALSGRDHFDVDTYTAAITQYLLTVGRASLLDFMRVPPWFPRPAELFGAKAVKTMHKMVSRAISERQALGPSENADLLDHMLSAKDPETGRQMSAQDVLHNMQFFIVAGHETTALTLSWALMMLANDQEAQEKLHLETAAHLRGRAATADDLANMPLVESVLQESLRLYPPVGLLARDVLEPDQIYDRDIRKRDTIFVNLYAMHRHKMYWNDPDAFMAQRFLPEHAGQLHKYQHLPFGAGPRICVGANFAMMQAGIILATLASRYQFDNAGPLPMPVMHMTVRPEPEVMLNVTRK